MRFTSFSALVYAFPLLTQGNNEFGAPAETFLSPFEGRLLFPGNKHTPTLVPPTTRVTLNGGEYETLTRTDGSFVFHDVKPGIHLLDVLSPIAIFSQVKINVPADPSNGKVRCLEYRYPGAPKQQIICMDGPGLTLMAHTRQYYFEKRPQVSIMGMIMGNPMLLMMGAMAALAYLAPGAFDMKELQEQQRKQAEELGVDTSDPMAMFSKLFSGDLGQPEPSSSGGQQSQQQQQQLPKVSPGGSTKRAKRTKQT